MAVENRGTLGDKYIKGLSARVFEMFSQSKNDYSLASKGGLGIEGIEGTELFKTKKSDKARETIANYAGVEDLGLTNEGEDYKSTERVSSYETQFDFKKYTQSITFTEEMREDEEKTQMEIDRGRDLIISGKRTINKAMIDLFNYSFTAQASLPSHLAYYGDGTPFCSTIHPIIGTTTSNASASGLELNETNLEVGRIALMKQVDDRGETQDFGSSKGTILFVPTELEKTAQILTNGKLRPTTANNDLNIYDGLFTVVSSRRLTSATAWWLVDSMNSPATYFERDSLKLMKGYITNSNQNFTIPIKARYLVGNKTWRGVWGSKGDKSAYSA